MLGAQPRCTTTFCSNIVASLANADRACSFSRSTMGVEHGGFFGRMYRRLLEGPWARNLRSGLQRRPGYRQTPAEATAAHASDGLEQHSPSSVRISACEGFSRMH